MRSLVLYYSLSGHTRAVAEALAQSLGADLREIICPGYERWYGPLLMAFDIFSRHRPRIESPGSPGRYYDLVVVGGPVWAGRAAPPVLRLLGECGNRFARTGLFVTCGGSDARSSDAALAAMAAGLPGSVVATRTFRAPDIASGLYRVNTAAFAETLRAHAAVPALAGAPSPTEGADLGATVTPHAN